MTQPQQQPQADQTTAAQRAAEIAATVAAYQMATSRLRSYLSQVVTAVWRSLGEYRQPQMRQFVSQIVPVVNGAASQMQALTVAYLANVTGASPAAVGNLTVGALRNGADPADVYGRPFHLVWRRLDELKPLDAGKIEQAIDSGLNRAVQTAVTDVQLAKQQTSQRVLATNDRVVGYRRVLEGPHSCALCVIASTVRYHKEDLLPLHPACDCSVLPLLGDHDPGRTIDDELLSAAHATVADKFGADSTAARDIRGAFKDNGDSLLYRDVLITHLHGELGPILGIRGQDFTGPSDIAA